MNAVIIARGLVAVACMLAAVPALAHGEAQGLRAAIPAAEERPFGQPGDPARVTRTVTIRMNDKMRYAPARLAVRRGETLRLLVRNDGKALHEIVLGTMDDLKAHAALMREHPGMEHDEPHMAHVAPGTTETMVWTFSRRGTFYYGCLVPGHFETGMVGRVTVR